MPSKPVVLINVLKVESKKQEALIALLKTKATAAANATENFDIGRLLAIDG